MVLRENENKQTKKKHSKYRDSDGIHQEIEKFSVDKNLVPEYFKSYRILFHTFQAL